MSVKYTIVPVNILLIAAFMFCGCNSSSYKKETGKDKEQPESYNRYFPVNEGNKWEYINEAPRKETEMFKVEITSVKSDAGAQIVEMSSFPFFSLQEEKAVLRVTPKGEVYAVDSKTQKEELFIPGAGNFTKGYQWQFGQWTGLIGGTEDTVKAENETFNDCIFLNFFISFTFSAEIWIAKDKGIVRWGYNRTNPPTLKPKYYVLNKMSLTK